jgi:hypothetical protein
MLANDVIDLVESAVIKRTVSYERAFSLHIEVAVSIQRSSGLSHTLRPCTHLFITASAFNGALRKRKRRSVAVGMNFRLVM